MTEAAADLLPGTLCALFGAGVMTESAAPALVGEQLFPDELAYIARAVETRQAQFGTARICARRALGRLGIAPCSLVPMADRAPQWPTGIRGSIAHTERHCAVAVSNASSIAGLGLDLESDAPVKPGLEAVICTTGERAWLTRRNADLHRWLVPLIFSAKEAFYKCQYPLTGARLGFTEVQLSIDVEAGTFSIADLALHIPQRHRLLPMAGRFRRLPGLIVTSAMLLAD